MRTIKAITKVEKRHRIAQETMEIYAPLADRMGMHRIRDELEDLSFEILNLEARQLIQTRLNEIKKDKENLFESLSSQIKNLLIENGINASIYGREKTPFSIWRKLQKKRVSLEQITDIIGFRIILDDADFESAITGGAKHCFNNSGQSCNAPTRMLVPEARHDEAKEIAKRAAEATKVGDPFAEDTGIGPVVSDVQFNKIQGLIEKGIEEGAELVAGGPGKPEGLNAGYFVRPTVFANVNNDMTIAREEIFGPVLSILPYKDEEEAVEIANDTEYGLYGYVSSGDVEHAKKVANRIRAGSIAINGAGADFTTPFGGYKQSGNGREWGLFGFEEFLEVKAVVGFSS